MSSPEEPKATEAVVDADATDPAMLEEEVAKSANRVMRHMNHDHEDSIIAYALALATEVENTDIVDKENVLLRNIQKGELLTVLSARMTGVDTKGFLLEVKALEIGAPETETLTLSNIRVPYGTPIASAKDIKTNAVAMHRTAYDTLGYWYKAKSGYYREVLGMVATASYKKLKEATPAQLPSMASLPSLTIPTVSVPSLPQPTAPVAVAGVAAALAAATAAAGYARRSRA